MEPRIGCRASGLGTGILLEGGIPMAETMQTLLQSIDEQLGDTNRQYVSHLFFCIKIRFEFILKSVVVINKGKFKYCVGNKLDLLIQVFAFF